jgi:hypothetical protein
VKYDVEAFRADFVGDCVADTIAAACDKSPGTVILVISFKRARPEVRVEEM